MRRYLLSLALAAIAGTASAQTYPDKQINLIVPFAAGGTSDIIARIAADEMSQILGQRILIENIGGAGGSTALTRAAAANPDGYTLVIGNAGTNAATYTIHKDLKFNTDSFKPIGMIAKTLPVIAVKNGFPAKDVKGFIEYAKANPGKITLGHAGVGSSNFLICKLFLQAAKVNVELIGYRGAGPALNDAMGGHVDGVCDAATSVASSINGGKIHGLVMAGKKRADILPQVPTAAEAACPPSPMKAGTPSSRPQARPMP